MDLALDFTGLEVYILSRNFWREAMKNRIYHFHPKNTCKSGITVVYDPNHDTFAVSRCSSTDHFNRRAGVAICETRLKTSMVATIYGSKKTSFQNNIFAAGSLGASPVPISALAFLLAEAVAMKSSDTSLVQHLAKTRPQIDKNIEQRFHRGLESLGWTQKKYCAEPMV